MPCNPCDTCLSFSSGPYGHTVKKYNSLGDLVQVLGTPGKKGTGLNPLQFDNPAELYVDDTGEIYIVDGDGGHEWSHCPNAHSPGSQMTSV